MRPRRFPHFPCRGTFQTYRDLVRAYPAQEGQAELRIGTEHKTRHVKLQIGRVFNPGTGQLLS